MRAIVADPVGDNIYFLSRGGIYVINTDGSGRKLLVSNNIGMLIQHFVFDVDNR